MKARIIALMLIMPVLLTQVFAQDTIKDEITFTPVEHATMIIRTPKVTIYVDPVGNADLYQTFARPDIILITHIHRDHLDPTLVRTLRHAKTTVIGPKEVIARLKYGNILNNGQSKIVEEVHIKAIPMYNLTKERLRYHEKGKGNGYVVTANKKRIYISGDTEDIKEMRGLKEIDYAFVCMNLPYTMTVEQAASAVLEMKPKVVFPYHYRGKDGFSDIDKFKRLVSKNKEIEVRILHWYKTERR